MRDSHAGHPTLVPHVPHQIAEIWEKVGPTRGRNVLPGPPSEQFPHLRFACRVDLDTHDPHDHSNVHPRRDGALGRPYHSTLCGREWGPSAPPPKEQPPWNLSGTRDRKGDDSLESERPRAFHRRGRRAQAREISQVPMTDRGALGRVRLARVRESATTP